MNDQSEGKLRSDIVRFARSMFERGLTPGSSGNISVRLANGYLATPTNACLGFLDPTRLAQLDGHGAHVGGDAPTKEMPLHLVFYEGRPSAQAVVHLHSTYATLLSCLADVDSGDAIPPITPYIVMRVGRVPVLHPYRRPGSADIGALTRPAACAHAAVLLANHGPVVSGTSLEGAVFAAEEVEETAKLVFLARGREVRLLNKDNVAELNAAFNLR